MLFHGKPSVQKEIKVKGRKRDRDTRCGDIDIDIWIGRQIDRQMDIYIERGRKRERQLLLNYQ